MYRERALTATLKGANASQLSFIKSSSCLVIKTFKECQLNSKYKANHVNRKSILTEFKWLNQLS